MGAGSRDSFRAFECALSTVIGDAVDLGQERADQGVLMGECQQGDPVDYGPRAWPHQSQCSAEEVFAPTASKSIC
jgi:hypothetical protein